MNLIRIALGLLLCLRAGAGFCAAQRPNVLLIMTDQQFADAMSCRMGAQFLRTPVMDRLASQGMLFSRAYSANPLCMPLRNSLFTGRYPHETGVTSNDGKRGGLDLRDLVCMGTYFRNAGYEAAYSGKWHLCFNARDPRAHGFEIMESRSKTDHDAGVTEGARRFLAREHAQPFLLVASFLNPHNICEWARRAAGVEQTLNCGEIGTPPPLNQLPPAPANLAPPKNEPDGMALIRRAEHATPWFPVGHFTAEDWRRQRWGYYRMIEKVDARIGQVLESLEKTGQAGNTLIIFTADHGECAGAHGFNQKTVFYEESTRVPLILAYSGKTAVGTCDKLVNTGIDILPTMLDCAGLAIPKQLPGRSLWPLARGNPVQDWRDCVVVQNHMVQTAEVDGLKPELEGRMVRSQRYKYCVYSRGQRRESLIDLQADPGETNDLANDSQHRSELLTHRAMLAKYGLEHHDQLVTELLANDVGSRPFSPTDTPAPHKVRSTKKTN